MLASLHYLISGSRTRAAARADTLTCDAPPPSSVVLVTASVLKGVVVVLVEVVVVVS